MKNILTLVLIALAFLTSCSDDDGVTLSGDNYLVFGHFYGECLGEQCVEIFRLEETRLLEDIKDRYPKQQDPEFYDGEYIELSNELFEGVRDLVDFFPARLLEESETRIGEPDAGDWGGLYIEYNFDGTRGFWLLDQMKTNVPEYLHPFIDKVNEKIRHINGIGS